ncbi:hypothetical protein MCOR27_000393 [Pyricularia oryzae]|nr:hypothetical protein MCOR02_011652 [Pyricularia oryzae]KAI6263032.1 hypothetical protein MCOR19_000844 [Pyricularia oryzae]KAI6289067.1 hypothetical protein MCOR27_000393 [Pyricularia oryzae]KAI6319191.1 hypothetical protein MCOR34_003375 [Pyricularia oryzae]KAI6391776.1 hypothetical protein MCOR23_008807 [Pyricularia oryzae]
MNVPSTQQPLPLHPPTTLYPSPPPQQTAQAPAPVSAASAPASAAASGPAQGSTGQQRELGKNALRRPHRKSRLGCVNCKARRVKCDESHPTCGFCLARQLTCQYPEPPIPAGQPQHNLYEQHRQSISPQSPAHRGVVPKNDPRQSTFAPMGPASATSSPPNNYSTTMGSQHDPRRTSDIAIAMAAVTVATGPLPPPNSPGSNYGHKLNMDDLELLLNFTNSTVNSMSRHSHILDLWREDVPKLALDHPFLMHAILALSSVHLGRFPEAGRHRSADYYFSQAKNHWYQAEQLVGPLLSSGANEVTCHALYMFALLAAFFAIARGPTPDSWLPMGGGPHERKNEHILEWSVLTRAIIPDDKEQWARLERGPVGALASLTVKCMNMLATSSGRPEAEPFRRLREYIMDSEYHNRELRDRYIRIVNGVSQCYSVTYDEKGFPEKHARDMGWYSFVAVADDTKFLELLKNFTPNALIIYAYSVVIVKDVDFGWMTEGWPHHTMSGIYRHLEPQYRVHLSWPIKKIGWVPPG